MAPAAIFFFIFIFLVHFCTIMSATSSCNSEAFHKIPAVLVFGDSTVDTGNNNYIPTIAKANHLPYGINFPGHIPTGRFSDGKLVPDFLVSVLGIKDTVPPFLQHDLSVDELRTGVCFASAGSGYDELTTAVTGAISMAKQLDYFRDYRQRLVKAVGEVEARRIVGRALIVISAGTNDFIINFYDLPTRKLSKSISEYQDFVLDKIQKFVKELDELGCRRIIISGLPPIGCVPIQRTAKSPLLRRCTEKENADSESYNDKLAQMLQYLQSVLHGSRIIYADTYTPLMDMINNPEKYGFEETKRGCCGSGVLEAGPLCSKQSPVCPNPSQHVFFDSIHPTEATYKHLAEYVVKDLLPKLVDL